jgi:hypothetical protein
VTVVVDSAVEAPDESVAEVGVVVSLEVVSVGLIVAGVVSGSSGRGL